MSSAIFMRLGKFAYCLSYYQTIYGWIL